MRIEVLVDGRHVAVGGIEEFGVVSATVSWVKRTSANIHEEIRAREGFDEREMLREVCAFDLTGLDSAKETHVTWAHEELRPGNEVTIRILGPGEFDSPKDV